MNETGRERYTKAITSLAFAEVMFSCLATGNVYDLNETEKDTCQTIHKELLELGTKADDVFLRKINV